MSLSPWSHSCSYRFHPARLAQRTERQAVAAFPPWQRLLRPHLRTDAASVGGGFRPLAVRHPGPRRKRPRRSLPRLEPQRRDGGGGLRGRARSLWRCPATGLRAQLRRRPQQPRPGPPSHPVRPRRAARPGTVHPGDDRRDGTFRDPRPAIARQPGEEGAPAPQPVARSRSRLRRLARPRYLQGLDRRGAVGLRGICAEGERRRSRAEVPAKPRSGDLQLLPQAAVAVAGQDHHADPRALR